MASLENIDIDFETVKENIGFEPLPVGNYTAMVSETDVVDTKSGGIGLKLKLMIIDGQYKNRIVFDFINLKNNSEVAEAIGQGAFKSLSLACGLASKPKQSEALHNIPISISLGVRDNTYNGETKKQNHVKEYAPLGVVQKSEALPTQEPAKSDPWA